MAARLFRPRAAGQVQRGTAALVQRAPGRAVRPWPVELARRAAAQLVRRVARELQTAPQAFPARRQSAKAARPRGPSRCFFPGLAVSLPCLAPATPTGPTGSPQRLLQDNIPGVSAFRHLSLSRKKIIGPPDASAQAASPSLVISRSLQWTLREICCCFSWSAASNRRFAFRAGGVPLVFLECGGLPAADRLDAASP